MIIFVIGSKFSEEKIRPILLGRQKSKLFGRKIKNFDPNFYDKKSKRNENEKKIDQFFCRTKTQDFESFSVLKN